jgi:hypothetical protein
MTALLDSGFIYAVLDQGDANHHQATDTLTTFSDRLVLPDTVLVEVAYLLQARVGHHAMRHFVKQIADGPFQIEALNRPDLARMYDLLAEYADSQLDFVDVSLVTIAERLNIRRILTIDRRDFAIIRPAHCEYFEILP